jgi:hypothetical protein
VVSKISKIGPSLLLMSADERVPPNPQLKGGCGGGGGRSGGSGGGAGPHG